MNTDLLDLFGTGSDPGPAAPAPSASPQFVFSPGSFNPGGGAPPALANREPLYNEEFASIPVVLSPRKENRKGRIRLVFEEGVV